MARKKPQHEKPLKLRPLPGRHEFLGTPAHLFASVHRARFGYPWEPKIAAWDYKNAGQTAGWPDLAQCVRFGPSLYFWTGDTSRRRWTRVLHGLAHLVQGDVVNLWSHDHDFACCWDMTVDLYERFWRELIPLADLGVLARHQEFLERRGVWRPQPATLETNP